MEEERKKSKTGKNVQFKKGRGTTRTEEEEEEERYRTMRRDKPKKECVKVCVCVILMPVCRPENEGKKHEWRCRAVCHRLAAAFDHSWVYVGGSITLTSEIKRQRSGGRYPASS